MARGRPPVADPSAVRRRPRVRTEALRAREKARYQERQLEAERRGFERGSAAYQAFVRRHRPREKKLTEERIEAGLYRPSPGRLTDTDRRFLKRQNFRTGPRDVDRDRFAAAREVYVGMTPDEREKIRDQAARLARGYSRSRRRARRAGLSVVRQARAGGRSAMFESYEYDLYEDFDEFDEFPDAEEPLSVLLFYHESAV